MEYFNAGVALVWMVDRTNRSIAVFSSATEVVILGEADVITGGNVLPGFSAKVAGFFADLDFGQPAVE